jgi:hypothetical protein
VYIESYLEIHQTNCGIIRLIQSVSMGKMYSPQLGMKEL